MNCEDTRNKLNEYMDGTLQQEQRANMNEHLSACQDCQEAMQAHRGLIEQLTSLPVPPASQGFNARVMRKGREQSQSSSLRLRVAGGMVGAFFIALVAVGILNPVSQQAPALQVVSMQVFETKTISLAFNAPEDMEGVVFTLQLPKGMQLHGRSAQTQLAWTSRLHAGKNIMTLKLDAKERLQGELIARVEHRGLVREFKVPLLVKGMDEAVIGLPMNIKNIS